MTSFLPPTVSLTSSLTSTSRTSRGISPPNVTDDWVTDGWVTDDGVVTTLWLPSGERGDRVRCATMRSEWRSPCHAGTKSLHQSG